MNNNRYGRQRTKEARVIISIMASLTCLVKAFTDVFQFKITAKRIMNSMSSCRRIERVFCEAGLTRESTSDHRGNPLFSDYSENIIYKFNESPNNTLIWSANSSHAYELNFD
jgi:hypothetical protein